MTGVGVPFRRLVREIDVRGLSDWQSLELLSVSQYRGVVPRSELTDKDSRAEDLSAYKRCWPDDIVLNRMSAYHGALGISGQAGLVSPDYAVLRAKYSLLPRFFSHVMKSEWFVGQMTQRLRGIGAPGSTSVRTPRVNIEDLGDILMPLPPLEEQRRIADFLDDQVARINTAVQARRRQMELGWASAYSGLYERVFPADGELQALRRLIESETLGTWGSEPDGVDSVAVARVADFDRSVFKLGSVPTVRKVEASQFGGREIRPGDLLLERSGGTNRNPVGCVVFVEEVSGRTVCSNFVSRLRAAEGVSPRYLSLVMVALYSNGEQRPHSNQTTGIQNLDTGSYFSSKVRVAAKWDQLDIAKWGERTLDEANRSGEVTSVSLELLEEYKRSLISAAVSGEFDVSAASGRGVPV